MTDTVKGWRRMLLQRRASAVLARTWRPQISTRLGDASLLGALHSSPGVIVSSLMVYYFTALTAAWHSFSETV
jgi:hypothetical protein